MIDVAFTRAGLRDVDIAIVVDVLRATSTATQALASGYGGVLCVKTIEQARELRGPGRVLAGERHCVRPPGFDQGNSPFEALECRGDELVLATTNGAPAIVAATRRASHVLLACMLNLAAVIRALRPPELVAALNVQIVCAGTHGAVALEDVYVAGRLAAGLAGERTDSALLAERVAGSFPSALHALEASAGAAALRDVGLAADIAYCARESELEPVGAVVAAGTGIAAIADLGELPIQALAVDAGDTVRV